MYPMYSDIPNMYPMYSDIPNKNYVVPIYNEPYRAIMYFLNYLFEI